MGILATVILVVVNPLQQMAKARDAGRISDVKQIQNAVLRYATMHGYFPPNSENNLSGWDCSNQGTSFIEPLVKSGDFKTSPKMPNHPTDSCGYRYYRYGTQYCGATMMYVIVAPMEVRDNRNMDQVPDCYTQKPGLFNAGFYGVAGQM